MASDLRDVSWMEGVWTAQDTTPAAIEAALRDLLKRRHAQNEAYVPARVLNLVVIADREWRGEILNRLERVGRYHPSRTILCAVENGRETLDAWATMTVTGDPRPGEIALCHEQVVVDLGPRHLKRLDTIVDPLVVSDIATLVWSPHGHPEAVDSLLRLAQVVLLDSVNEPDPRSAVERARELTEAGAYVVDLAWLRSTPWRERVAATFDPAQWRPELGRITGVKVRHRPDSALAGVLFCGWLCSRLGWQAGSLMVANGSLHGRASGKRADVELRLEPDPHQNVPGLTSIEIGTASGMSIALERGPGGLSARRHTRDGDSSWTVLGASRGEAGILGEGIRQALLRDKAYRQALDCAEAMLR
jgi:glucose-6-phosphate dehydrogenase assembly protein OpcA